MDDAEIRRRWSGLPKDCPVGTLVAQRHIQVLLAEIDRLRELVVEQTIRGMEIGVEIGEMGTE